MRVKMSSSLTMEVNNVLVTWINTAADVEDSPVEETGADETGEVDIISQTVWRAGLP